MRVNAVDELSQSNSLVVLKILASQLRNENYLVRGYIVLSIGDIAMNIGGEVKKSVINFLQKEMKKDRSRWVKVNYYYSLHLLGQKKHIINCLANERIKMIESVVMPYIG